MVTLKANLTKFKLTPKAAALNLSVQIKRRGIHYKNNTISRETVPLRSNKILVRGELLIAGHVQGGIFITSN